MPDPKRRSICPVACSLDIIGDKWTLLIVRDLICGKSHFKEFSESPEKIAPNILSSRLERLLHLELIETFPSQTFAGRKAYRLSGKGRSLIPLVTAIADWGLSNIDGTEMKLKPIKIDMR